MTMEKPTPTTQNITLSIVLMNMVMSRFSTPLYEKEKLSLNLKLNPKLNNSYGDLYAWLKTISFQLNNTSINPYFPLVVK